MTSFAVASIICLFLTCLSVRLFHRKHCDLWFLRTFYTSCRVYRFFNVFFFFFISEWFYSNVQWTPTENRAEQGINLLEQQSLSFIFNYSGFLSENENMWHYRDSPAYKSYSPDLREHACLVQTTSGIFLSLKMSVKSFSPKVNKIQYHWFFFFFIQICSMLLTIGPSKSG